MKKFVFLLLFSLPAVAATPLFQSKKETFKIVDAKAKAPQFRLLSSSVAKKSLAVALNAALKLNNSDSEVKNYVDVRPEKVIFEAISEKADRLSVTLLVSGREFYLDETLSQSDFKAGKKIAIQIPSQDYEVAMFTVTSKGNFTIQYDVKKDVLLINQAYAHFDIENPMTEEEPEKIQFSGQGIRQLSTAP